jgi:hypothetical protein
VVLRLKFLLQSWKSINSQIVITFWQNWLKQEMKHYCLRSINSLILFRIRKNCLINGRSLLLYQFTSGAMKLILIIIMEYHWYQLHTIFSYILLPRLSPYIDEIVDVTDQLLIRFSAFIRYWTNNKSTMRTVHQLFIDFKKAYDSVRREVMYKILI